MSVNLRRLILYLAMFIHLRYLRNRLPVGGGCIYVLQMFFFVFFSVRQKYETTVLGNG